MFSNNSTFLQMDGISKNSRKIRSEAAEYKYPLSLFSYDKWIKIATKVASNLIQELFQMKATCKVFLDAAKSDVVFKHSTMWYLLQGVSYFLDRATMDDHIEASYICAMLLLCANKDEEHRRRGVEFFKIVLVFGAVKRCKVIFRDMFQLECWVEERPLDPGQPITCQSTRYSINGVMSVVEDVYSVSYLHCLADYEYIIH
ncbi:hypothetical protein AHAS_Ahas20G0169700 [Arachis hypogaea]